jgi:lysozyme family protein
MSQYRCAIKQVLVHEGGYVNHPNDPGGPTNFGVSLAFLKDHGIDLNHDGVIDITDVKNMTIDQAVECFKIRFWDPGHYELVADQTIATKVFDMAVNMGPPQAHKLVQRACTDCGDPLVDDGALGTKSFGAINRLDPKALITAICKRQAGFYRALVAQDSRYGVFLAGWLDRAAWPDEQTAVALA